MALDRSFVEGNRAATNRIRKVAGLSDEELKHPVGEHWTVAVVLAHITFWDRRVMVVLDRTTEAGKVSPPDIETVVNDISLPLWLAIPPREAGRIAIATAEELDHRLETYPTDLLEQIAEFNIRYVERSRHRNEHMDEAEQALKA